MTEPASADTTALAPARGVGTAWWRTEDGWRVMLGVVPLLPWAIFHLTEQWTALGGRAAWLGRMRITTSGAFVLLEPLVVAACAVWLVLLVRARLKGRGMIGAEVMDESPLARWLGTLEEPAALGTAALVLVHAATLWLPRFVGRASLAEGYEALRSASGRPPGLALIAVGLSAFAIHVACSLPTAALVLGWGGSRERRQATRLVSVGLAFCLLLLTCELAGWHATGAGVVWPIRVIEVSGDPVPMD